MNKNIFPENQNITQNETLPQNEILPQNEDIWNNITSSPWRSDENSPPNDTQY